MAARFTYDTIELHRKKGKHGEAVTDPATPGLSFPKMGDTIYARWRGMNKGTGKRDSHYFTEPMPSAGELRERAKAEGKDFRLHAEAKLEQVRAWARQLRRNAKLGLVSTGADPAPVQPGARTVADLAREYQHVTEGKLREKTRKEVTKYLLRFVLPQFGTRAVESVTRQEIETLHASLAKTPYLANRLLSLLRVLFNKAVDWGWRTDNPARGIKLFHEAERKAWMKPDQLAALLTVLDASDNKRSANAVKLMMFTGARKGEALGATWDQFDLKAGTWTKPGSRTKQKEEHHIPINSQALALLRQMHSDAGKPTAGFLFPGEGTGRPLADIKRFWQRSLKEAGLDPNWRVHDLRHSFASVLVSGGTDLYTVGALLGHAEAKTTQRYAHLSHATLKDATEAFGKGLGRATPKGRKVARV